MGDVVPQLGDLGAFGVAVVMVFGATTGSFLNVVALRVPAGESIVTPRSRCPGCGHQLRWFENLPVVSWLALRARCAHCAAPISVQYPAVEVLTAVVFTLLALRVPLVLLPAAWWVAGCAIAASVADLRLLRLPNQITAAALAGAVPLVVAASGWSGNWGALWTGVAVAMTTGAVFAAVHLVVPRGFGAGDVKFVVPLTVVTGWLGAGPAVVGVLTAFATAAVVGVAAMLAAAVVRRPRPRVVPFGPFLAGGYLVALTVGPAVWSWYLGAGQLV